MVGYRVAGDYIITRRDKWFTMIATENNKRSSVIIDLSQPRKEPPLLPKIMQKPLGIGCAVGLSMGVLNTIVLGIPLLLSVPVGIGLGLIVCVLSSPGMRHELAKRKQTEIEYNQMLLERKGRASVFTQFD